MKAADGRGFAQSYPFALWNRHHHLASELRTVIAEAPASDHLAITMTGELADCFASKAEGVRFILQAVEQAADGRHTRVYLTDGRLVTPRVAMECWRQAASSNWHALARYCGRFARKGTALLIDVGSTTVDIIPLRDGQLAHQAATDLDRLLAGELVYTGMERTPVCALVRTLPHGDARCPIAPELFATTQDVHLLLGNLAEDAEDRHTADHEPATREAAHRRMARMLCADKDQISSSEVRLWAREIAEAQLLLLIEAATRVLDRLACSPSTVISTGHGEALTRQLLQRLSWTGTIVSLHEKLAPAVSRCAPAHALAMLAREGAGS